MLFPVEISLVNVYQQGSVINKVPQEGLILIDNQEIVDL